MQKGKMKEILANLNLRRTLNMRIDENKDNIIPVSNCQKSKPI